MPVIESYPSVTVLIPCLNEETYIEGLLQGLVDGDYPLNRLEVLVLDGMSTDNTRQIVQRIAAKHAEIKLIDNPGGSKPKALNLGIEMSNSEMIVRLDAHAQYPSDYILKLVLASARLNADNIGGVRRNRPRSAGIVAETLGRVLTNKFGVGDAKHYTGVKEPYQSDIVFLFCVKRSLFDEVGTFDERLLRGQDREFNLRLSKLGKRCFVVPDVESVYFSRDRLENFVPWAIECGATPLRISQLTGVNLISLRNLIPVLFLGWLFIFGLLSFFSSFALVLFGLCLLAYFSLALLFSCFEVADNGKAFFMATLPLAFFLWHTCYGFGFLRQAVFPHSGVRA